MYKIYKSLNLGLKETIAVISILTMETNISKNKRKVGKIMDISITINMYIFS